MDSFMRKNNKNNRIENKGQEKKRMVNKIDAILFIQTNYNVRVRKSSEQTVERTMQTL